MDFANKDGISIVYDMIHSIQANREYLSEVDSSIGDGDHGINMSKGFTMAEKELDGQDLNMSEGLMVISKVLVSKIGGSMGPLYGNFFRGLSTASKNAVQIDGAVIDQMLEKGLANVRGISPAEPGDKTLIDVLYPAVTSYHEAIEAGASVLEALNQMVASGEKGREATKEMVAKLGRASRLGEQSLGHVDAGATSCQILLTAFAKGAERLMK